VRAVARSNIDPTQSLRRREEKLMRTVILVGVFTASAYVANAQDAPGNSEAGRVYVSQVCSPCHAVTAEQAAQRRIVIAPDFQAIANTPG
jgi:hypothetical protein